MKNVSLATKLMLLTTFIVVLTSSGLIWLSYQNSFHELESTIGVRLKAIAATGALLIDGDLHEQLKEKKDVKTEAFLKLRKVLRSIKDGNDLKSAVYTFRKLDVNALEYVVMTQKKAFLGHTYKPRVLSTLVPFLEKKSAHSSIYGDEHGYWISASAPILNAAQKVVGSLNVDVKLKTFEQELRKKVFFLLGVSSIVLLFGLFLSFLFSQWFVRRMRYLRDVTEKISLGDMDEPIVIDANDELGQLAESLERMRESLKIAMEMISEDDDD